MRTSSYQMRGKRAIGHKDLSVLLFTQRLEREMGSYCGCLQNGGVRSSREKEKGTLLALPSQPTKTGQQRIEDSDVHRPRTQTGRADQAFLAPLPFQGTEEGNIAVKTTRKKPTENPA